MVVFVLPVMTCASGLSITTIASPSCTSFPMLNNGVGWQVLRTCTYRLPGCRYIEACWAYSYCAPRHADNYKLYPSQSSMHMLRVLKGKESLKHLSTSMIKKLGCKNRVCPGTSRATSKIKKQFSRESSIHKKNALFIA